MLSIMPVDMKVDGFHLLESGDVMGEKVCHVKKAKLFLLAWKTPQIREKRTFESSLSGLVVRLFSQMNSWASINFSWSRLCHFSLYLFLQKNEPSLVQG